MKKILILGAGLSSSTLIKYLLDHSEQNSWKVRVGDLSIETAKSKVGNNPNGEAFSFDVNNNEQARNEVKQADLVVSMLPASMHYLIAAACLEYRKTMVTASYVSKEIKAMEAEAIEKGILILNEIGVDPGIDHMSAMAIIDRIKEKGGKLTSFKSFCGGLIAPKHDNNPWNYKFTWNPRNVVVAGQGSAAQYIEDGKLKFVPYQKLFERTERAEIEGCGEFEVYMNRDSVKYLKSYNLEGISTLIRGTMRRPGYCKAWNAFVQLGATDDTYTIENSENMTYKEFLETFVKPQAGKCLEQSVADYLKIPFDSNVMYRLRWLDLFKNTKIGLKNATPAQILQKILVEKWVLDKDDKDMIAMQHIFEYELKGVKKRIKSSLVVIGQDDVHTAMSITVGMPVAIAVELILKGKMNLTGVHIPVTKNIYEPVLKELEQIGINFIEEEEIIG